MTNPLNMSKAGEIGNPFNVSATLALLRGTPWNTKSSGDTQTFGALRVQLNIDNEQWTPLGEIIYPPPLPL